METSLRVLGQEHPDTVICMNNLAHTWKLQGRDNEAFDLMSRCMQLAEKKFGVDHPNTVATAKTLENWCNGE